MQTQHFLLGGLVAIMLAGGPLVATAADTPPSNAPTTTPAPSDSPKAGNRGMHFCKDNPDQCKDMRARRGEFCQQNPDKCKAMKEKRQQMRDYCKANPDKCKAEREQFKAKRDEIRAKCKADPDKCEQIKQEARQQFRDKYQGQKQDAGQGT
ncbi:MAG: hypothetical protein DYH20_09230 [Gammaproteobacteria bacterium PRO9]|nr:hypothetical protein [Gammaproteobacteria bacterium PRO9]